MIKIIGVKGNIKNIDDFLKSLEKYSKEKMIIIQAFDADVIFGKNHLTSAVDHAIRSIENKTNTTNSLEKEILLYASGERQIKLAIQKMGVKRGKSNIALVFFNLGNNKISDKLIIDFLKKYSFFRDDKVLQGDENTLKKFGISKKELETVNKDKYGQLILEKVAMVDIIK